MKRNYMKCISAYILRVLFCVLFLSAPISAEASYGDYSIESYHIDMVVREDNTFEITEEIMTYFYEEKHGIFRKIPLKNSITRTDGTESKNKAQITDIDVSENYTLSKENGCQVIKIGSKDSVHTGIHSYVIKYTYNIGKDPLKDADELYFNLIGDQWDTSISNVTFTITMPKDFDPSSLGFSSGYTGSMDSSNVSYTVDGRVINGFLINTLNEGEALTVRLTLPEGYFVGAGYKINIDMFSVLVLIFGLTCVLVAAGLWWKYGKDDKLIETVEFYPPEGCDSAEAGFLYNGKADNKSIISLLIYLADKGYLKIEETGGRGWKKQKGFRVTKLREYYGDNDYERMFFRGLFRCSTGTNKEWIVTDLDLYDKFYQTLNSIRGKMNSKENKNRIFEESSMKKRKWLKLMVMVIFVLITVKPIMEFGGLDVLPFALLFPGVGFTVMFVGLTGKEKIPRIFGLAWGGLFGGIPWAAIVFPALGQNRMYLITYLIGLIYIAVLIWLDKIMPKRTPYGKEMLGKLSGFKRFLKTAEKSQLESLVEQNPEYYYHILPYTYALGVSDVWMKQFETIALQQPEWYGSYEPFNTHDFNHFMNNTMNRAQSVMSSSPSSSSSGGGSFSGGGSSGGGSGGGGGGSW